MESVSFSADDNAPRGASEVRSQARVSQFVAFSVGENAYGVDIMSVREIRSWSETTTLPDQSYGARGVLDIRGRIVEVFDLASSLGAQSRQSESTRVVLVVAREGRDIGMVVDAVSDIVDASPEDFRDPPNSGKVLAIVKQDDKLISILDLNALFS